MDKMQNLHSNNHLLLTRWLLALSIIMQGLVTYAQNVIITKENNMPIIDDILQGYHVDNMEEHKDGNVFIWDLSNTNIDNTPIIDFFLQLSDTSSIYSTLIGKTYIHIDGLGKDTLYRVGYENYLQKIIYHHPEITMKFPFILGDSLSGYFEGKGEYCDKLKLRSFGRYSLKAEKMGIIILPNGNQLNNSILIHTQRYLSSLTYPLNYSFPQNAIFVQDSIDFYIQKDSNLICQEEYNIFSKGYRYPIIKKMVTSLVKQKSNKKKTEIIFYNPEEQNKLSLDDNNRAIRNQENDKNYLEGKNSKNKNPIIEYRLIQNKENKSLQFTYSVKNNCDIYINISDASGINHKSTTIHSNVERNNTINLNYGNLQAIGPIIVYIKVKNEEYIEKFNQ